MVTNKTTPATPWGYHATPATPLGLPYNPLHTPQGTIQPPPHPWGYHTTPSTPLGYHTTPSTPMGLPTHNRDGSERSDHLLQQLVVDVGEVFEGRPDQYFLPLRESVPRPPLQQPANQRWKKNHIKNIFFYSPFF